MAPEVASPKRLILVGQAIRDVADGPLGEDKLAERLLQSAFDGTLGHPTRIHLDDQRGQHIAGAAQGRPQLGAIRFPEVPALAGAASAERLLRSSRCQLHSHYDIPGESPAARSGPGRGSRSALARAFPAGPIRLRDVSRHSTALLHFAHHSGRPTIGRSLAPF